MVVQLFEGRHLEQKGIREDGIEKSLVIDSSAATKRNDSRGRSSPRYLLLTPRGKKLKGESVRKCWPAGAFSGGRLPSCPSLGTVSDGAGERGRRVLGVGGSALQRGPRVLY